MSSEPESSFASGPVGTPFDRPSTTRRGYLGALLGTVVVITGITFIYPVLAYLSPRKNLRSSNPLTGVDGRPIRMSDLEHQGSVMGMGVNGEATIVMRYADELRAFSAVCTHLGCLVKWHPASAEFICPCHAGKFDANGVNIFGVPPTPLKRFRPYTTAEGYIGLQEIAR